MRVTELVAEQRDAVRFIYGLPKHLPYYCRVVMAVLKSYKIYDACEIINIDIRSYRLKFKIVFRTKSCLCRVKLQTWNNVPSDYP